MGYNTLGNRRNGKQNPNARPLKMGTDTVAYWQQMVRSAERNLRNAERAGSPSMISLNSGLLADYRAKLAAAEERDRLAQVAPIDPCADEEPAETFPIDVVETCFDCVEIIEDGRPGCDCCDPMPSLDELLMEVAA